MLHIYLNIKPLKVVPYVPMNTTPGHAELLLHAQDLYLGNKVHRLLYHICLHTCSSVE